MSDDLPVKKIEIIGVPIDLGQDMRGVYTPMIYRQVG